jgi:hypothetical protein
VGDENGEICTVRYEAVNAMLLNEFLKEHRAFVEGRHKVEEQSRKLSEQGKTIAELKCATEALSAAVRQQATQIQKVSAQLDASRAAPQVLVEKN